MKLAHEIYAGHLGAKKTKERIKLSFTWPTIASDVQKTCESCHQCQMNKRVIVDDRNFGSVDVIHTDQFQKSELVPSQRVDLTTLSHLSVEQSTKRLALLNKYSEGTLENPDFSLFTSISLITLLTVSLPG